MASSSAVTAVANEDKDDSTAFGDLWTDAIELYRKRTGVALRDDTSDLSRRLVRCDSESAVLEVVQDTADVFTEYRSGNPKLKKLRDALKPIVRVVLLVIEAGAEGAASKSVVGGKAIFVAVGILLKTTQCVTARFDALVDLLESLGRFLAQLGIRSNVPMRNESKHIVVEILAEVLKMLALATKMMKDNRLKHFVRELFKGDEMTAARDRLEKLMIVEDRMTTVDILRHEHQGAIWQRDTSDQLGRIEATSTMQHQELALLLRRLFNGLQSQQSEVSSLTIASARLLAYHEAEQPTGGAQALHLQPNAGDVVLRNRVDIIERRPGYLELGEQQSEPKLAVHRSRNNLPTFSNLPKSWYNAISVLVRVLPSFSSAEQDAIRRDLQTLLLLISGVGAEGAQGDFPVLYGVVNAINPVGTVTILAQTLVAYLAIYLLWRLVCRIALSLPNAPGINITNTIVLIDILGLEVRLPLERCVTFDGFHQLLVERLSQKKQSSREIRVSEEERRSQAWYIQSRSYEVADTSSSAVIYPEVWGRKVKAGMKLELTALLRRTSITCPYCEQEHPQSTDPNLWIHCDCDRVFQASRDHPESNNSSSAVKFNVHGPDEAPSLMRSFRKVHFRLVTLTQPIRHESLLSFPTSDMAKPLRPASPDGTESLNTIVQSAVDADPDGMISDGLHKRGGGKNKSHIREHETIYASSDEAVSHMQSVGGIDNGKAWRTVRRPSDVNEYARQIREYRAQEKLGKGDGRVFMRVFGARDLKVPIPQQATALTCTLDNGIHCVTTSECRLVSNFRIDQEFELIEHRNLEFTLTLKIRRDPHIMAQFKANELPPIPRQPLVHPPASKNGIRSFFSSSSKKPARVFAHPPPPPIHRTEENLARYLKQDGTLARAFISFKEIANSCDTRLFGTTFPLIGQRLGVGNKSSSLQVGELMLQFFWLPPLPGVPAAQFPRSLDECQSGLRHVHWHKMTHFEGILTQSGGDCTTWRRRQFRIIGANLVAYHDVTKRATTSIDLRKVVGIEDLQDPGARILNPTSSQSSHDECDIGIGHSFRITFKGDEEIGFFADSDEEKARWLEVLRAMVGHIPPNPLWAELLWQRKQEIAQSASIGTAASTAPR